MHSQSELIDPTIPNYVCNTSSRPKKRDKKGKETTQIWVIISVYTGAPLPEHLEATSGAIVGSYGH
eukprot:4289892-Amphidinium_carterae.1